MSVQYIFGNPTGTKRRNKVRKTSKKKNPVRRKYKVVDKKTKKVVKRGTTSWMASQDEIYSLMAVSAKLARKAKQARGAAKKAAMKKSKRAKAIVALVKKDKAIKKSELSEIKKMAIDEGLTFSAPTSGIEYKSVRRKKKTKKRSKSVAKKKKKVTKRKATKKKATKRKAVKKRATKKKVTRKKATKKRATKRKVTRKKATRKKATRRKATKRKVTSRKKRRSSSKRKAAKRSTASVTVYSKKRKGKKRSKVNVKIKANPKRKGIKKRSNPMKVKGISVTGFDNSELMELGLGGLAYGVSNKYISPIIGKIPVIGEMMTTKLGGTLPTLLAGAVLNALADKFLKGQTKKYAGHVADGMIAASIVGVGVHLANQYLPAMNMAGVDYFPNMGDVEYTPELMGSDADFGDIDYTPNMSGVEYIAGGGRPGHGNSDFGEYEESDADFGIIPTGLG